LKNIVFAGLISVALWSCQSSSQENHITAEKESVEKKPLFPPLTEAEKNKYHDAVEDMLKHTLYRSSFNGGVLVAKNGTIVYEKYTGFHDLKQKDSLHADIPFQIASTSKPCD
jgi:CubicO group peptidase (beta-lactamase class C family)